MDPVDRNETIKSYELSKGEYVLINDDEITVAKVESKKTLELVQFGDEHNLN